MSVISLDEWRKRQEDISASNSQSKQNTQSDKPGPPHTDDAQELATLGILFSVLARARTSPFTTKSDFARMAANEIALLASEGLLSNMVAPGHYTNKWMVTETGLEWMSEVHDVLDH